MLIQAKEMGEVAEGNPGKRSQPATVKLSDLGITKNQSSDWQAMAHVDEETFREVVEYAKVKGVTSDRVVATG